MVTRTRTPVKAPPASKAARSCRVLIIESRYYGKIADALLSGAELELRTHGASFEITSVPGALEIPQVLAAAVQQGLVGGTSSERRFDGVVALGCVIRGETSHYDIVCNNANHWLMHLAIGHGVPVGNAILTVETEEQALVRAEGGRKGKGADAVRACLRLVEAAREFERQRV